MATTATVRPPRSSNPFPTVNCRVTVASGPRKGQQCGKACGPEGLRGRVQRLQSALLSARRQRRTHVVRGLNRQLDAARTRLGMLSGPRVLEAAYI